MKIAVIHSAYRDGTLSGENNVVQDQVACLRRAGLDVRFMQLGSPQAPSLKRELRYAATTFSGIGPSPLAALDGWTPDIVHVHNTFPNWGTRWRSRVVERLVVTAHNYRAFCAAGTAFRDGHECLDCLHTPVFPAVRHACYRQSALASLPVAVASSPRGNLRGLLKDAARVVVLNEVAARRLRLALGRPVDVVPNFVQPSRVREGGGSGWVFAGRLSAEKGVSELVSAWPPSERLDIVGDGPEQARLRSAIARAPNIRYVGRLDRDILRESLGSYRGLILPSLWSEGLPTVLLEALSAGLHCIVSSRVELPQELSTCGAVVRFDPLSRESLSDAVASVLTRPILNTPGIELVARRFSMDVWLEEMGSLYRGVIDQSRWPLSERD